VPASGWQVIQERDKLSILLSGTQEGPQDAVMLDELRRAFAALGVNIPPITIQHVAAIPRNESGKAPLIVSHVPRSA
jgi:hypothetical protein